MTVRWRPFLLGPIFKSVGWTTSPFSIYADKGRYMWRDMEREAERLGVDGWGPAFVRKAMHANFAEDRDIAEPSVLDSILAELGLDGRAVREESVSPARSPALRRSTEEAVALSIFGAPTFMVGQEMFWGNDRLEHASNGLPGSRPLSCSGAQRTFSR